VKFLLWLIGYFTSSAAVVVRHCPRPPPPSSITVVCQYFKNPHLRILPITSTDFLRKIYPPQFTSCNISTSAYYHWLKINRRLADGNVRCAGSATYQICFRLPISNPNPNPITDPNLTLKITKSKQHRNEIEHRVISKSRFTRDRGGFIRGL